MSISVSVVIATYNSNEYLYRQLDSIRTQTDVVDEVIIYDDCSKNNTPQLIIQYICKHNLKNWFLYQHSKNCGYIQTFADALEKTHSDIIVLCDHDDIWLPNKISLIKEQFISNDNLLSLSTGFEQIDAESQIVPVKKRNAYSNNNLIRRKVQEGQLNKMTLQDVVTYNISPGCTSAIRRSLLPYYTNSRHILPHDWELNILASCLNGLYFLDQKTTMYRIYGNNTIGLGHESRVDKRKKLIATNLTEKQEITAVVSSLLGDDSEQVKYCRKVENIFANRKCYLEEGKLSCWIRALILSIGINGLYESILLDMISTIKR